MEGLSCLEVTVCGSGTDFIEAHRQAAIVPCILKPCGMIFLGIRVINVPHIFKCKVAILTWLGLRVEK